MKTPLVCGGVIDWVRSSDGVFGSRMAFHDHQSVGFELFCDCIPNLSASSIPTLAIKNASVFVYDAQPVCVQKHDGETKYCITFGETSLLCQNSSSRRDGDKR
jgi:hypothetical protein